jgi:hypothetical protein
MVGPLVESAPIALQHVPPHGPALGFFASIGSGSGVTAAEDRAVAGLRAQSAWRAMCGTQQAVLYSLQAPSKVAPSLTSPIERSPEWSTSGR